MWQYLFGYVMIQMNGYGLERYLNRMLQTGIPVWNIRRESANCMTAEIRAKHFKRLKSIKRGARCRVHIVKKRGMPFLFARLNARKPLVIGAFFCFLLLLIVEKCIWAFRVEGLDKVPLPVIERAIEEAEISVGMLRADVNNIELANKVRAYDERIAWAGVRMDGVTLCVRVVEAEPIPQRPDLDRPANIVARKDAVIDKVIAKSGKACIVQGSAVRAGEALIKGDITREGASEPLLICAQGEVFATVYNTLRMLTKTTVLVLKRSGKSAPYRSVLIAGYPAYISPAAFQSYEVEMLSSQIVSGALLPLRVLSGRYHELIEQEEAIPREEQLATALYEAEYALLSQIPKDARILDKAYEIIQLEDGGTAVELLVRTYEEIGIIKYLDTY